ncbi:MAG: cytochrome c3 family protein [Desulfobacterales bacterium]
MKIGRLRLNLTRIPFFVFSILICLMCSGVYGAKGPSESAAQKRADIIRIDSMQAFGKLERPPVTFLHQKHTEALATQNKDCSACHLVENNRLVPKFMRLENTAKQEVMDVYHVNCVACHKETAAAKQKSGPVVCGECHRDRPDLVSIWQPIGMDRSLHYRHSKAQNEKCERCHHEFNEVTKKLYHAEGKEGTCRYCHKEVTEENRISLQLASHLACIDCHSKTLAKSDDAGPITCGGCHDPAQQQLVEKLKVVPRIKRNQPDMVFVRTTKSGIKSSNPATRMKRVPFNHKAHENYNDTCRVCHHANLNACVQCHTPQGTKEGDQVTLEASMHRLNVNMSCLGCHELNQRDPKCAGCHAGIARARQQDPGACQACHMGDVTQVSESIQNTDEKDLVARMLDSRNPVNHTFAEADIPESVEIKTLMNQYGPVKLPHRKIVQTLFGNIKDNSLVRYFHRDENTLCQGCHHHSPAAKKPPSCASCHGQPFDERDPFKPGLMAAYHRQCMECHEAMGIEKPVATNCVACHQKKG